YSRGRFYRGRFKALVIFQAVSLSYVLFGFALYLSLSRGWLLQTPRLALLLGWFLTVGTTAGARLWTTLWQRVMKHEAPARRKLDQDGRIRHVLVIGGAGFIGSVLCRQLLRQGYSVRVLDTLLYGRESLADLLPNPNFELLEGDSRDVGTVFRAMFDLVVNLLTAKAVRDGEITIFGGDQWRPFVHVADIAQAIIRSLEAPLANVKGAIFNVGSDEQNYTITRVGELVQQVIPQSRLV